MNSKPENVILAVGAHPDDMDFGASGTIAKFVGEGYKVYYLLCTDGSRGSDDLRMTHERLAQMRKSEQKAAGKVLGVTDIFFLDHPDTQLEVNFQLKEEIVRVIKTVKPRIVITMDPTFYYSKEPMWGGNNFINHTDHRAAAQATIDAVFPLCRDRLTFPLHENEGLMPHLVEELWFTNLLEKSHVVDISKTFAKKIKALECHKSQFDDFATVKKRMTDRAIAYAEGTDFEYGENFTRLLLPGHRK